MMRWRIHTWRLLCLIAAGLLSCARAGTPRDWQADPAVLQLDTRSPLYAISDIHGGYQRLAALLTRHRIIRDIPAAPESVEWTAGAATLVVSGDLIDRGPDGLGVIDLLRALEPRAVAAGGRLVVTLGNHEAEFLADPHNQKAAGEDGLDRQLVAQGIDPDEMARGADVRGAWLRRRPFAARVGRWFFSHAGDTHGRSTAELEAVLRAGVDEHNYDAAEILGDMSILESEDWTSADKGIGDRYARAVGALHLVFGHNPSALGLKGVIEHAQGGALFRIDCGMSPYVNYSEGAIFQVKIDNAQDIVSTLKADGSVTELWRGSIP